MERPLNIASHPGIVQRVRRGFVEVQIESVSACATCSAHAHCGFAESKNKTVEVPSADWQSYHEGDLVTVHIDQSRGMLAVWFAYLLPALLLLGVIVGFSVAGFPEGVVALSALLALALYVGVLFLLRRSMEGRFTLTVSHNEEEATTPTLNS